METLCTTQPKTKPNTNDKIRVEKHNITHLKAKNELDNEVASSSKLLSVLIKSSVVTPTKNDLAMLAKTDYNKTKCSSSLNKLNSTQNMPLTPPLNDVTSTTSPFNFFEKIATAVTNVSPTTTISSAQLNGLKNMLQAAASTSSRITSPIVTSPSPIPNINYNNKKTVLSSSKSNSPTSTNLSNVTVVELLNEINRNQRSNSPKELKRKLTNSPSNSQSSTTTTSSYRDYEINFGASNSLTRPQAEKRKLKQYTTEEKMDIIDFAKVIGNRAAGRQYGVAESSIREWRKNDAKLKSGLTMRFEERFPDQIAKIDQKIVNFINEKTGKEPIDWYVICDQAYKIWLNMCNTLNLEQEMNFSMGWVARFMERNKERVPKIAPPVIATANALNNNNGSNVNSNGSVSMVRRQSTIGIERNTLPTPTSSPTTTTTILNNNGVSLAKKLKISTISTTNSKIKSTETPFFSHNNNINNNNNNKIQKVVSASSRRKCQQPKRDANATVIITSTSIPITKTNKNFTQNNINNAKNLIGFNGLLNPFLASNNLNNNNNKISNLANIFASTSSTDVSTINANTKTTSLAKSSITTPSTLSNFNINAIAALFNTFNKQNNNIKNNIFSQNGTNNLSNYTNLTKLFSSQTNKNGNIINTNNTNNNIRMGIETNDTNNGNAILLMQFIQNLANNSSNSTKSTAQSTKSTI